MAEGNNSLYALSRLRLANKNTMSPALPDGGDDIKTIWLLKIFIFLTLINS